MTADAFRELYRTWYVPTFSLDNRWLTQEDAIIERFDLDHLSFLPFLEDTVTISQSLFPTKTLPTSQRSVRIDAHWVSFSTKKRPVESRSQIHACNYPSIL
jgi:hypothetical protein